MKQKIIIIGAGPGGLSAGMILAHRGYEVVIYEKEAKVGGRNASLKAGDFTFEVGPTFVMLPDIFVEVFKLAGEKMDDYLTFKKLDILYRLNYANGNNFLVYDEKEKLKQEINRLFPGEVTGYEKFMAKQKIKFDKAFLCLKVPYQKWYHYFRWKLIKALPYLDIPYTVHQVLSKYFKNEDLKIAMSFQAKYLGMSPWHCPGIFTILSYTEHAFGIFHPMGGVHKISEAMAEVAEKNSAKIHLNSPVKQVIIKDGQAVGVELENGETDMADKIIMNADFAYGMTSLVSQDLHLKKYNQEDLKQRQYSCSTFMLYLGVDKKYDFPHHNIFFSNNYKQNVEEIFENKVLPQDPSFYIHNASVTDDSLAPAGKSVIYVLVPIANLEANINWSEQKQAFRDLIIKMIMERTEMKDLADHIEVERIITPADWQNEVNVYKGAVFNLAHNLGQMLYLRPHNEFEKIPNLYIVGGGTHPGSGLPTIVESGRITADLISEKV
jgi:phytoene desaturase